MKPETLLERFLSEECTPSVRLGIEEALGDPILRRRVFEFNVVEIIIDKDADVAELADVLGPPEAPTQRIALTEFASALSRARYDLGWAGG